MKVLSKEQINSIAFQRAVQKFLERDRQGVNLVEKQNRARRLRSQRRNQFAFRLHGLRRRACNTNAHLGGEKLCQRGFAAAALPDEQGVRQGCASAPCCDDIPQNFFYPRLADIFSEMTWPKIFVHVASPLAPQTRSRSEQRTIASRRACA